MSAEELSASLPAKLAAKVARLAKKKGVTAKAVIEEAVRQYGEFDPEKMTHDELKLFVSEWFKRTARKTNAAMSPEARRERGRLGALGRNARRTD